MTPVAEPRRRNIDPIRQAQSLSRAHAASRRLANAAYADVAPAIIALRGAGLSLYQISAEMNAQGRLTRQGARFTAWTVAGILKRAGSALHAEAGSVIESPGAIGGKP